MVLPEQWNPGLEQEVQTQPPHIKEEQEEPWSSQEEFTFTPVLMKTEDDEGSGGHNMNMF